jgi:hypothetical protein
MREILQELDAFVHDRERDLSTTVLACEGLLCVSSADSLDDDPDLTLSGASVFVRLTENQFVKWGLTVDKPLCTKVLCRESAVRLSRTGADQIADARASMP